MNIKLKLVACVIFLLTASVAFAQSDSAKVSGRVTDQSGAIIVGAECTATNIFTNISVSTVTNTEGIYVLPNLRPSTYRLTIAKDGFNKIIKPGLEVHAQDSVSENFILAVGSVSQSITVEGGASLLNTETGAISTLVDQQFVQNMPLNGRSFQSLLLMTPGVVMNNSYGQLSFNGMRTNNNYFTLDGVSATFGTVQIGSAFGIAGTTFSGSVPTFNALGGTNSLISVDALQEFTVQSSSYAAEFGRNIGGQVQMTSRSGGNQFHGTLFEYFRNDKLDANDWFSNSLSQPRLAERQNDFGGTLGGPVIIPKLYNGKDHTFFFFSYEGLRLVQPIGIQTWTVPSMWLRTYPGLDPGIRALLNGWPTPNGPDRVDSTGALSGTATRTQGYSNPNYMDAYSGRVDHVINSKLTIFARYSYSHSYNANWYVNILNATNVDPQSATAGATYQVKSNMTNEFRANWSKNQARRDYVWKSVWGGVAPSMSIFGASPLLGTPGYGVGVCVLDASSCVMQLGSSFAPLQRQLNAVDNLTWLHGTHTFKFGFDYRLLNPVYVYGKNTILRFTNLADIKANRVGIVWLLGNDTVPALFKNYSSYAQDTWRVSRRLTLDYGVRWEVNPSPSGRHPNDMMYVTGWDNLSTLQLAPPGTRAYKTNWLEFAPRVGVAYQLRQKAGWETVLRGGWGLYYDLGSDQAAGSVGAFPHNISKTYQQISYPVPVQYLDWPVQPSLNPPYPSATYLGLFPNFALPRTQQWSISLEQALGHNQALTLSYVGNSASRLMAFYYYTAPASTTAPVGTIYVDRNDGVYGDSSNYNAMQVQFQRRMARGLQVLANWTWSHSFNTADDSYNYRSAPWFNPNYKVFLPANTYGVSGFDRRHILNFAVSYNLPSPRSASSAALNAASKVLLKNWSLDAFFKAQSGSPFSVTYTRNLAPLQTISMSLRADVVPGVAQWINDPAAPGGKRLNPAAFAIPASAYGPIDQIAQGSLQRNSLLGFGINELDLTVRREFKMTERFRLQFRAEMFNALNHPNFTTPNPGLGTITGSPLVWQNPPTNTFGRSTSMVNRSAGGSTGFNALYTMGGPRSIQFALKIVF